MGQKMMPTLLFPLVFSAVAAFVPSCTVSTPSASRAASGTGIVTNLPRLLQRCTLALSPRAPNAVMMATEQLGRVTMYMRPGCPFCAKAKVLLEEDYGIDVSYVDIWEGTEKEKAAKIRQMTTYSGGRQTVPQIFFNDEHLGGNDDVQTLHAEGLLQARVDAIRSTAPRQMKPAWYHPHY